MSLDSKWRASHVLYDKWYVLWDGLIMIREIWLGNIITFLSYEIVLPHDGLGLRSKEAKDWWIILYCEV